MVSETPIQKLQYGDLVDHFRVLGIGCVPKLLGQQPFVA